MSEFKTNLFKLLNQAEHLSISGYEIEVTQDCGVDDQGRPVMRCECDEDNEWYFADQEVVVREGECQAVTATGDWPGDEDAVTLEFKMWRPIEATDLRKTHWQDPTDPTVKVPVRTDAERLDWLRHMASQQGGLRLHSGDMRSSGEKGLNINGATFGGDLRTAIDWMIEVTSKDPSTSA